MPKTPCADPVTTPCQHRATTLSMLSHVAKELGWAETGAETGWV